jgi:hypothetical protein
MLIVKLVKDENKLERLLKRKEMEKEDEAMHM